ncbi:hypothetical protein D3C76_1325250 [compost metagenome]
MRATLHHFGQRKRLLARITLHLLGIGVIFFQLFVLFWIALQDRQHWLQFRQLIAVQLHKARGFLRFIQTFLNFIHAIGQGFVAQQIQTRQDTVQSGDALFRLLKLHAALLVIIFMIAQRAFQFATAGVQFANFGFRIGLKGHCDMAADKAAERLV